MHFSPKQREALRALTRRNITNVLYGGAKGGGKSVLLCWWCFITAWNIAHRFGLKKSKNPPHVGFIGRKQGTDLTKSTMATWRQFIPEEYYELKSGTDRDPRHILLFDSKIAIDYGGLDHSENINQFNSAEYAFFAVDQAEETDLDDVAELRMTLRMKINGQIPMPEGYKALWTANPRACWLRNEFILNTPKDSLFIQALPADNPYLAEGYIETIRRAVGYDDGKLKAYLEGSWDVLSGADQIIQPSWIEDAKRANIYRPYKQRIISVDTARFGDDETVVMCIENDEPIDIVARPNTTVPEIENIVITMMDKWGCGAIIESTGGDLGASVIDGLRSKGRSVTEWCPQRAAIEKTKYGNARAEAWCYAARELANGRVSLPADIPQKLSLQLCEPRYKFKAGKTYIESKKEIKDRTKCSPDWADCWVIGKWGQQFAETIYSDGTTSGDKWKEAFAKYGYQLT